MIPIVEIRTGSHLYGTDTLNSDLDYKIVFVPSAEDIVLQRIHDRVSNRRIKLAGEKNTPDDIDREAFALHRFLNLLAEGQTLALDMLFAPASAMMYEPAPLWHEIVANRHRLFTRQAAKFVTYCETQARKYGIKGSRIHAVRGLLDWFDIAIAEHGEKARVASAAASLVPFIADHEMQFTQIIEIEQKGPRGREHLECCNLKVPFTIQLTDARAMFQRVLDRYGARALLAESNQGVDYKALSHAVRVGHEAIEFLATGWITFPRPEAEHLLAIKLGKLPYAVVATEIETLLDQVKAAQAMSSLPDEVDHTYIDSLVAKTYGQTVVDAYGLKSVDG
jgi:RNA repair pathway DNA polymerase beta family